MAKRGIDQLTGDVRSSEVVGSIRLGRLLVWEGSVWLVIVTKDVSMATFEGSLIFNLSFVDVLTNGPISVQTCLGLFVPKQRLTII